MGGNDGCYIDEFWDNVDNIWEVRMGAIMMSDGIMLTISGRQ